VEDDMTSSKTPLLASTSTPRRDHQVEGGVEVEVQKDKMKSIMGGKRWTEVEIRRMVVFGLSVLVGLAR
jgi:hypothetical protein